MARRSYLPIACTIRVEGDRRIVKGARFGPSPPREVPAPAEPAYDRAARPVLSSVFRCAVGVAGSKAEEMLHLDFAQRVVLSTREQPWESSPAPGVERKKLARADGEQGHATSVVRYAAGARFPSHGHPGGEEIFVLEGTFSDETGDYPAGTYLRNPPGFSHAPSSRDGCVIFVKLHQFLPGETQRVCIRTPEASWLPGQGGLRVMPLHEFGDGERTESTALVHWPAGERFKPHRHFGGEEIFVLRGEFADEFGRYPAGTWLRNPDQSVHEPFTDEETVIWVKVGHLPLV